MNTLGLIAGVAALAWAYAVAFMTGVALVRRAWHARPRHGEQPRGRWLVVRPCAGAERALDGSLRSIIRRADRLDLDLVIGVSEASDPALPIARRVCTELAATGLHATVEVVPPAGPNRKASTLAGVLERRLEEYAGVINIDSNVDMTGLDLGALVAPLGRPRVGATWMPPVESAGTTLGDRASRAVLAGSFHAFGLLSGLDPAGLVGKVFAVRRDAAGELGLGDLAQYLGEDVELSARLRAAGFTVEPVRARARALPAHGPVRATVARHARWITVVRAQRPALLLTYPLLFAPTPAIAVLAVVALLHSATLGVAALAAALAARLVVSAGARYASGLRWSPRIGLVDALLADGVLWAALARSLRSREVEWRGRRLRIDRTGRLHAT